MSDPLSGIPSGLRYFFGREARVRRTIEDTALAVFAGWSYEEITTPTIDYYSLFEQGMGSEASNSFRFMDGDGKLLALRPDVTSGVARAAVTLLARKASATLVRRTRFSTARKITSGVPTRADSDWL